MGRFATTVALYEELRPPYPPAFFRRVAEQLGFRSEHALIDLGTGPGLLALGFAPYVGRIVGVDPEPAMIAAASAAAVRASRSLTLIEGKAEELPADIGSFDVVTVGRALHWMERDATLALFERLVAPEGVILVCSSHTAADGRNPWLDEYNKARHAWSQERLWSESSSGARTHRDLAAFFRGTRFQLADPVAVEASQEISVTDLARRVLTFSSSSPGVLGDKASAMLDDVAQRLLPSSRNGVITEVFVASAQVARR
ncbi:class I SAM-dependent methyltransferase [Bradyrhizobium lablabi]|uniref:class I SAM-dependent methyltransferase n=1 Tax=Bradyrhizobium lablabi TaxID=722472 RepID=UPI001BA7FCEB|nr:class I SAM-dependent methyltransferase [Bradyrhizobium lablabi]MBR1125219.1 class I SAM-dependent methyltransferase [Bradyrhizobium lablabi]